MGDQADQIDEMFEKDPTLINQMSGFWKQLDDMASTDKSSYEEFIKKQKTEFEEEKKEQEKKKEKLRIVQSSPLCCIKILVAKVLEQK